IQSGIKDAKKRQQYQDGLALSIYRQGENALKNNDMKTAIALFTRISTIVPNTETGATGLYDAIALYMQASQWDAAIASIEKFQQLYPRHKYHTDVSKKLSVAYLNSDQGVKAAQEFEKLARTDSDYDVKAAALWKAAELYEAENKSNDAIKAYQDYAKNFRKPYTQRLEAMYKVAQLHQSNKADRPSRDWYQKIIKADEKALNNARTEQSRVITSTAYLALARHEHTRFDKIKLTLPLKNSLTKKKAAMQNAVKLFGKASVNKNYEITTEATYSIASIYKDFSQSLLASDRPDNLNQEELDQYEILLEDQAFPFEDKSIEFFEINLSRVKEGLYNNWIQQSHKQLIGLFPVRYNRQPKLDEYIATLQ
ncbi:MAG: tetratricopeptide repeat protein, partial [Gammaproteobacteria bacterium]|nr:tetratricopeptide repeat protein [Gammaproteobacteria bacterium]